MPGRRNVLVDLFVFHLLGLYRRFEVLGQSFNLAFADCSFVKDFVDIAMRLECILISLEVVEHNVDNIDMIFDTYFHYLTRRDYCYEKELTKR